MWWAGTHENEWFIVFIGFHYYTFVEVNFLFTLKDACSCLQKWCLSFETLISLIKIDCGRMIRSTKAYSAWNMIQTRSWLFTFMLNHLWSWSKELCAGYWWPSVSFKIYFCLQGFTLIGHTGQYLNHLRWWLHHFVFACFEQADVKVCLVFLLCPAAVDQLT